MAKGKPKSKIVCPACESIRSESHGARETKSLGLRQRRRCLECGYLLRDLPERRCPACGTGF